MEYVLISQQVDTSFTNSTPDNPNYCTTLLQHTSSQMGRKPCICILDVYYNRKYIEKRWMATVNAYITLISLNSMNMGNTLCVG